jgi:hypothetical protein
LPISQPEQAPGQERLAGIRVRQRGQRWSKPTIGIGVRQVAQGWVGHDAVSAAGAG